MGTFAVLPRPLLPCVATATATAAASSSSNSPSLWLDRSRASARSQGFGFAVARTGSNAAAARRTRVSSQSSSKQESETEDGVASRIEAVGESQPEIQGREDAQGQEREIGEALRELRAPGRSVSASTGFWEGLGQEIGLIEWPDTGKVFGTTVVVLGIIVGSSIVLLSVNFLLAGISDVVFKAQ